MTGILAIETGTEACSLATYRDGDYVERFEVTPRLHNQRFFALLDDLLPEGGLARSGINAIAYGCGPGSFTGLRIAASAAQGLAFASRLQAVAVCTLACQAQTALREYHLTDGVEVLSLLDARIGEVYYAQFVVADGKVTLRQSPRAAAPEYVALGPVGGELYAVGSGCQFVDRFPSALRSMIARTEIDLMPHARDLIPLALEKLSAGEVQSPRDIRPVYVRDEISWKKIPEQGKRL